MKPIALFIFFLFHAAEAQNGLPDNLFNEIDLYRWDSSTRYFTLVPEGTADPKLFYVKWFLSYQGWAWVSGGDLRPILPKSKAQGFRIGVKGKTANNWYRLDSDRATWRMTKDRERPSVLRLENGREVVSETAPDGWEHWGGELVEDNGPKDGILCILSASPTRVRLNKDYATLTLKTDATVKHAFINGDPVTPPVAEKIFQPTRAGRIKVEATVISEKGTKVCSTEVIVDGN